jgi:hypothetical protein
MPGSAACCPAITSIADALTSEGYERVTGEKGVVAGTMTAPVLLTMFMNTKAG